MNETMNYDVAIIGGGLSGLFAAARAAEMGVPRIAIFEAGGFLGGNGRMAGAFYSSDFSDYGNYESDENANKVFRHAMNQLNNTGNPEVIRRYTYNTRKIAKWFEVRNLQWKPVPLTAGPFYSECSLAVEAADTSPGKPRLGAIIADTLSAECRKHDSIDIHFHARAIKLLTNGEGTVNGVLVSAKEGNIAVNAKKVILSCGGVGGSYKSLEKYLPKYQQPGDYMGLGGIPTCVGDGIAMSEELGAETRRQMRIHLLGPGYAGNRHSVFRFGIRDPRIVMLNKKGLRIADESCLMPKGGSTSSETDLIDVINLSPGKVLYGIFDRDTMEKMWQDTDSPGYTLDELPEKLADDIRKKYLLITDTIEGIAEFIGCDPEVVKASIDRYNSGCEAGFDDYMLKDPKYLSPIKRAPYYVLYAVRNMDSTQGGITINKDFEAVTPDGRPIKGMYITGDHATGFVSDYYGPAGAGMTWAMVSGYLAGEDAAKAVLGN